MDTAGIFPCTSESTRSMRCAATLKRSQHPQTRFRRCSNDSAAHTAPSACLHRPKSTWRRADDPGLDASGCTGCGDTFLVVFYHGTTRIQHARILDFHCPRIRFESVLFFLDTSDADIALSRFVWNLQRGQQFRAVGILVDGFLVRSLLDHRLCSSSVAEVAPPHDVRSRSQGNCTSRAT